MTDEQWFDQFTREELRKGAAFREPTLLPVPFASIARVHLIANVLDEHSNYDCPSFLDQKSYSREYTQERMDMLTCGLR